MWVWIVVFTLLAQRAGHLSRVYSASCLKESEMGCSHFATPLRYKAVEGRWMDGLKMPLNEYHEIFQTTLRSHFSQYLFEIKYFAEFNVQNYKKAHITMLFFFFTIYRTYINTDWHLNKTQFRYIYILDKHLTIMESSWWKLIKLKQEIDIFKKLFKFSLHSKNTVITRYLHPKNNMY